MVYYGVYKILQWYYVVVFENQIVGENKKRYGQQGIGVDGGKK